MAWCWRSGKSSKARSVSDVPEWQQPAVPIFVPLLLLLLLLQHCCRLLLLVKWPEPHLNTRLPYKKPGGAVRIDTSANLNKHLFTPADGQIEFDALMETLMCGPRGEIKIW